MKNGTRCIWVMIAMPAIIWIGGQAARCVGEEVSVLVNKPENSPTSAPSESGPVLPPPVKPSDEAPITAAPLPVPPQTTAPPANPAVKRPFMRPAVPRGSVEQRVDGVEPIPVPQNVAPQNITPREGRVATPLPPGVKLMPTPPIKYDTDGDARKLYRSSGKVDIVMLTQNPADGCFYEIPLSIPGCCAGQPLVAGGRGVVTGRGKVEYRWPCGFRAIVKFRQARGDVEVEYEGD